MSRAGTRPQERAPSSSDRMIDDRLRRAARRLYLGTRGPLLLAAGLLRHRVPPPPPDRVASLLALRTDRIGDMALTTAALQDLRDHFDRASITILAPPGPLALLEGHPAVDRRHALDRSSLPAVLVRKFDLVVDFTPDASLEGAILAARTRAQLRAGFAAAGREVFFNITGPAARRDRHIIELNQDLLAALGVPPRQNRPALYVTQQERGEAQSLYGSLGAASPRVVIHPGGRYPTQRWIPEHYAQVITWLTERHGVACIVLSGPGEEHLAREICEATPDALLAGVRSVRGMMGLIATSDLFIGNNSGPLHVAGALGVPTVSVMGPTDPVRFEPRGPADTVVRHQLSCSPCDRGRCWHHTCLREISPEEVVVEAEAALALALPHLEVQ